MSKKRMLILVNQDLKISKEKLGVQIGHAVSTFMYYHYIREMAAGKDIKKELEELKVYMEEDNQGKILLACPERKLEELEKEGKVIPIEIDLTQKTMFDSEAYYLQSNDIVYVEPTEKRKKKSYRNPYTTQYITLSVSVANLLLRLNRRWDRLYGTE